MTLKCTYKNNFIKKHTIKNIKIIFNKINKYYFDKKQFAIAGRLLRRRTMGNATFLEIQDDSDKIQLYLSKNITKNYKNIILDLNLGDIIGVKGFLFTTKSNELSLKTIYLHILAKNLKQFPDKISGLLNKDLCYRKRYLDLTTNEKTKNTFILRSKIITFIRNFFLKKNFIEVETPIMQNIPGGADAKPFITYHEYLNTNLYLRISPELYLKKLIIGGFEKIFEIGKNFRNEGMSAKHHQEFTMIEFYQTYSNYRDLISLTENLLYLIAKNIFNNTTLNYKTYNINLSKKFTQINFLDTLKIYCEDLSDKEIYNKKILLNILNKYNITTTNEESIAELQCKIFDNFVEKNLINPTFVMHHPIEISPLAKLNNINKYTVERFELYICGKEIANGFSELNDPIDQKNRFINQIKNKNDLNLYLDKDYIEAMEFGLPPTAGEGIGLDRLIMLFTNNTSIKDVILFPFMKKHDI